MQVKMLRCLIHTAAQAESLKLLGYRRKQINRMLHEKGFPKDLAAFFPLLFFFPHSPKLPEDAAGKQDQLAKPSKLPDLQELEQSPERNSQSTSVDLDYALPLLVPHRIQSSHLEQQKS